MSTSIPRKISFTPQPRPPHARCRFLLSFSQVMATKIGGPLPRLQRPTLREAQDLHPPAPAPNFGRQGSSGLLLKVGRAV